MDIHNRIECLVQLGEVIELRTSSLSDEKFLAVIRRAEIQNPWFTRDNILAAFTGICQMLRRDVLEQWADSYPELATLRTGKTLGAVLAGNLPMVGFHDMLCSILCGMKFRGKLSSKDKLLLPYVISLLAEIDRNVAEQIHLTEGFLTGFDLVIATGSDNSSRYFDYYFSKYPNIIRHNRSSVAVLTGEETENDITGLCDDVFLYFGLGCRNVSKLYVPEGFRPDTFYQAAEKYANLLQHNKYLNNYEYRRALLLINMIKHYDNGFCLLVPQTAIGSPIGELYYEEYTAIDEVARVLAQNRAHLQCIVSRADVFYQKNVLPGRSQFPAVDEYADGTDTVQFLINNA